MDPGLTKGHDSKFSGLGLDGDSSGTTKTINSVFS